MGRNYVCYLFIFFYIFIFFLSLYFLYLSLFISIFVFDLLLQAYSYGRKLHIQNSKYFSYEIVVLSLHSEKKQITQLYIFISVCFELSVYSWNAGIDYGIQWSELFLLRVYISKGASLLCKILLCACQRPSILPLSANQCYQHHAQIVCFLPLTPQIPPSTFKVLCKCMLRKEFLTTFKNFVLRYFEIPQKILCKDFVSFLRSLVYHKIFEWMGFYPLCIV